MRTDFSPAQMDDPVVRMANDILRRCVHCGFCNSTCPTYVLLGDELDSPRGRICMIKGMLEKGDQASEKITLHVDRCLSCLSCTTTCPASVDYMHLVDKARAHIERFHRRPWFDRVLRDVVAAVLPNPKRFRWALLAARLARPLRALFPGRLGAILELAEGKVSRPAAVDRPQVHEAEGTRRLRVALLTGCAQPVLRPEINEATVRLLTRHGCDVVIADGMGCCGALVHHLGREAEAHAQARANIEAWERIAGDGGLDAIVTNASGCGTMLKDYGFLLGDDPDWAGRAARIAGLARDLSEIVSELDLDMAGTGEKPSVVYQAPCSLQHGQKIRNQPQDLLRGAGFEVSEPAEAHLCCGSAGTYNMFQPELAGKLRDRKVAALEAAGAEAVATANIGCLTQLAGNVGLPVVHVAELLDWATGGPRPRGLAAKP